jgi:thiol-disulfide isomerase/thioredoxin
MLLTTVAFVFNASAQQRLNKLQPRAKSSIVKKEIPADDVKSPKDVIFSEDFSNSGFDNWTIMGEGTSNWSTWTTNMAGGSAPEAAMTYSPAFNGVSRLVSPVVNTDGYSELYLSFLHGLEIWTTGADIYLRVQTTDDGGANWYPAFEINKAESYYAAEEVWIANPSVGSENFQFCLEFEGNTDFIDWWVIDNVSLSEQLITNDVGVQAIFGFEEEVWAGDDLVVSADIKNFGAETTSFDVVLEITDEGALIHESTISIVDLPAGEADTIAFDAWVAVVGDVYTATVTTILTGDENPDNDQLAHQFPVYDPATTYCFPGANCNWGDGLTDFAWAGIENYDNGCSDNGYGDFTDMEANVEIGNTYTATLATGYANQYVSIWIDFNQDIEFSESERVVTDLSITVPSVLTDVDIVIPGYALPGTTTMRIGVNYNDISSPDPCADFTYGEWEDYTVIITGSSTNIDAGVSEINMESIYAPGNITPKAIVTNYGFDTISFPVTATVDGGSYTSTIQVDDLGSGESIEIEFDAWNASSGSYTLEVTTQLDGDENPDNDVEAHDVVVVDWVPEKMVVAEEGTGTWCGWCVRGIVYMDSLKTKYPESFIGIAVHMVEEADPMVIVEYDTALYSLFPGVPYGFVDRTILSDPEDFEAAYLTQINKVAPASISVENKTYDPETGELTFTLTSEFVAPVSNYRFNAVIIENGVTGPSPEYDQANSYSGGGAGPMGGWENLPNPVPAEDMVYNDVARAILGGFDGVENSLPGTINIGETHSWEFITTIDDEWDFSNIEIVGMLIDHTTGEIENATIDHLFTGVRDIEESAEILIYPNPATGEFTIKSGSVIEQLVIYNQVGQLVKTLNTSGSIINIDITDLETGIYFVRVFSNDQVITEKVVIE